MSSQKCATCVNDMGIPDSDTISEYLFSDANKTALPEEFPPQTNP